MRRLFLVLLACGACASSAPPAPAGAERDPDAPPRHIPDDPTCDMQAVTGPATRTDSDGPAWAIEATGDTIAAFRHWGDAVLFVDALCAEPH